MKILVVDDLSIINDRIERLILDKYPDYEVSKAACSGDVVRLVEEGKEFDLVFIDINLGEESGISVANYLSSNLTGIRSVFISGYPEMVSEVFFSVQPFGFIDKPIKPEKLYKYVDAANEKIGSENRALSCKVRGMDLTIRLDDILYIEYENKNLIIHKTDGNTVKAAGLLEKVMEQLTDAFIRCHKSYIVNLAYVVSYIRMEATMKDGSVIAVGRSKKEEFENAYLSFKGLR